MLHHIPLRQKIITMIAVMCGMFLVALDQTIIATALTKIVEEFNDFSGLSWIVTAYLLTSTVTVPIAGKLSDIFGRRLMLLIGVAIFTLTSLFSGSAENMMQLILARSLQGIGGGIIMANAFTIIGDLFSPRERGRWQGFISSVFGLASVIGPLLGGFLTDGHNLLGLVTSWRWNFWINVPIGIVAFIMIMRYCPSIRHDHKPKIDYAGASLITVALTSLILAVDNTKDIFADLISQGVSLTVLRASLYGLAVAATVAFVWVERKAKEPIISLKYFKNRTFSSVMIIALLFGAAFLGAILYLTQFNQQVFGADATKAGLMLLPMITALTITSAVTGQIVSRTGKYKVFFVGGLSLATLCVLSLSLLQADSPYWHEAIIMALVGMGLGTGMPIMNLAVQNEFEQRELGAVTASSQLFRGLGSTIGTAIMGSILTLGVAHLLGNLNQDPYIETLKAQPAAAQIIGSDVSTDTALTLNQADVKQKINSGLDKGLAQSNLSPATQAQAKQAFLAKQQDFKQRLIGSFVTSLHRVFYVAAALMAIATVVAFGVKERPLRGHADDTPGAA